MIDKEIERLIKENFKDIALRLNQLNEKDRNSLLAEHHEWIHNDLKLEEILMLPYEAYTNRFEEFLKDD